MSTWLNEHSRCMIKTDCASEDISAYDVSLMCVGKDGQATKHEFGVDAFDPQETFDTLRICARCESADEYDRGEQPGTAQAFDAPAKPPESLHGGIGELLKSVNELKAEMKDATAEVHRLEARLSSEEAAEPRSEPTAAPAAPAAPDAHQEDTHQYYRTWTSKQPGHAKKGVQKHAKRSSHLDLHGRRAKRTKAKARLVAVKALPERQRFLARARLLGMSARLHGK